jgi:hypothetical protein
LNRIAGRDVLNDAWVFESKRHRHLVHVAAYLFVRDDEQLRCAVNPDHLALQLVALAFGLFGRLASKECCRERKKYY